MAPAVLVDRDLGSRPIDLGVSPCCKPSLLTSASEKAAQAQQRHWLGEPRTYPGGWKPQNRHIASHSAFSF